MGIAPRCPENHRGTTSKGFKGMEPLGFSCCVGIIYMVQKKKMTKITVPSPNGKFEVLFLFQIIPTLF